MPKHNVEGYSDEWFTLFAIGIAEETIKQYTVSRAMNEIIDMKYVNQRLNVIVDKLRKQEKESQKLKPQAFYIDTTDLENRFEPRGE